jgi:hypothetical protein
MATKIEYGTHWQIQRPNTEAKGVSQGIICQNPDLGVTIFVYEQKDKIKIPIPPIDPSCATGEGVFISRIRDEEGGGPTEFLNIGKKGYIAFYEDTTNDRLTIRNDISRQKITKFTLYDKLGRRI